jgi:hypothetical protein
MHDEQESTQVKLELPALPPHMQVVERSPHGQLTMPVQVIPS